MSEIMTLTEIKAEPLQDELTFTAKAISEIKRLKESNNIPAEFGLRVGVKGGGCSGFSYTLAFDAEPREGDRVIDKDGIKVFVDNKSLFYLAGTHLDYSDGLNGKGFVFNNPNATQTCGCGSSFGV